jgi:rare lipoprotein A
MRTTRSSRSIVVGSACVATMLSLVAEVGVAEDTTPPQEPYAHHAPSTSTTTTKDGRQRGNASYYSRHLSGRRTASGERYDPMALTAAHRTLPLGTQVRVVNPANDKSVVVTVNDRGPVPKNRVIDVSGAAAEELGMKKAGVTKVETEVVAKTASPKADDTARR